LTRLQQTLAAARLDALVVSGIANVRYLTGFTGSTALLLVTQQDDAVLFADGRYRIQARQEVQGKVVAARGLLARALIGSIKRRRLGRLAFDHRRASSELYDTLRSGLPGSRLEPLAGAVEKLRAVKSPEEIALIRRSVALNSAVFERSLQFIRPGR